jgi:hypothetical protein
MVGHKEIMDLLIAKEAESDSGKENMDDRNLVKRQVKKESNQARYCLVNPQTGDEAFSSRAAGLWR